MSTSAGPGSTTTRTGPGRRPAIPGRRQLLGAVAMVAIGSFLPWLDTALGQVNGVRGAGLWTFYAAMLGLAGVLVPVRVLALVQGAVMALVAMVIPVWQVVHVLRLVGTEGWTPGPGLVVVFGGGVLAAVAVRRMSTAAWA